MNINELVKSAKLKLLPPRPDVCQMCAVDHTADLPHDQTSLFWQYWFYGQHQKWPTWLDAMAHCTPEMQQFWVTSLRERGVEV